MASSSQSVHASSPTATADDPIARRPFLAFTDLVAECDRVEPGHALHRQVMQSSEMIRVIAHDRLVVPLRDLVRTQVERPVDLDRMLGLRVVDARPWP